MTLKIIVTRTGKMGPSHMLSKPQIHKFITVTITVSKFLNYVTNTNAKILSSHVLFNFPEECVTVERVYCIGIKTYVGPLNWR